MNLDDHYLVPIDAVGLYTHISHDLAQKSIKFWFEHADMQDQGYGKCNYMFIFSYSF